MLSVWVRTGPRLGRQARSTHKIVVASPKTRQPRVCRTPRCNAWLQVNSAPGQASENLTHTLAFRNYKSPAHIYIYIYIYIVPTNIWPLGGWSGVLFSCMHACIACVHRHAYACIRMHMHAHTHAYACICIRMHMHAIMRMHMHIQMQMHACMHVCMHGDPPQDTSLCFPVSFVSVCLSCCVYFVQLMSVPLSLFVFGVLSIWSSVLCIMCLCVCVCVSVCVCYMLCSFCVVVTSPYT